MDAIFELKNINLYYGQTQAIKGIDMTIERNKVTAFIGPSGCGKSTFIRILNRMNDLIPECKISGDVQFEGKDAYALNFVLK
jgi:phosphate transport system ATP-binding protein